MLLSEVLPEHHFREHHARRVDASSESVFAAVREVTLGEMPIARTLMRLRGMQAARGRTIGEELQRIGFKLVAEDPLREMVWASVGQPWMLLGGKRRSHTDFRAFAEPGYAKMALNFRFEDRTLSTETRVLLTDDHSRRAFRRYWRVIRPFSGLIRRLWLRAIERRTAARVDGGWPGSTRVG